VNSLEFLKGYKAKDVNKCQRNTLLMVVYCCVFSSLFFSFRLFEIRGKKKKGKEKKKENNLKYCHVL